MSASVITHSDAPPVLELCKHVLNNVPFAVEMGIMGNGLLPVFARRNTRCYALFYQFFSEPICIIPAIGNELFYRGKNCHNLSGRLDICRLSRCEHEDDRTSLPVAHGMKLCIQAAFCAPDTAGKTPFFSSEAAVR